MVNDTFKTIDIETLLTLNQTVKGMQGRILVGVQGAKPQKLSKYCILMPYQKVPFVINHVFCKKDLRQLRYSKDCGHPLDYHF